jgi:hypothetical protein
VNAAVTASTDSAVPIRAARTGTAVRPRPGSSASRTPVVAVSGAPAPASDAVKRDRRPGPASALFPRVPIDARRHAGHTAHATSSTTMAAAPAASTVPSALMPGSGSASRAAPIGISGDAAIATPAAIVAPAAAATPTSISPAAVSCARVMPSTASVGLISEPVVSNLEVAWPMISSAVIAKASAKTASAIASGRIAC